MYLIVNTVDDHNKEKNGNKYLVFDSTGKTKEVLNKYTELWDGIKHLIWKIDDKPNVVWSMQKILWKSGLKQMMICLWINH